MTYGSEEWQQLTADFAAFAAQPPGLQNSAMRRAIGGILDLEDRVAHLAAMVQDLAQDASNRDKFNLRAEALEAARKHVAALPSEQQNAKGYRDHALPPGVRIDQELKVARYLLMEDE